MKYRHLIYDKTGEDDEDVVRENKGEAVLAHEAEEKVEEAGKR